jgi:hypothetical protein
MNKKTFSKQYKIITLGNKYAILYTGASWGNELVKQMTDNGPIVITFKDKVSVSKFYNKFIKLRKDY